MESVLRAIQLEQEEKTGRLTISNTSLTQLPNTLFELTHLYELTVCNTTLQFLPPEIGLLRQLRTLRLFRNYIRALPLEMSGLTQLQYLDLDHNQLEVLPDFLVQLTGLRSLRLAENRIAELPARIGELKTLTFLDLSHNRLSSLPASICSLASLKTCHLHGNEGLGLSDDNLGRGLNEPDSGGNASIPALDILKTYFETVESTVIPIRSRIEKSVREWLSTDTCDLFSAAQKVQSSFTSIDQSDPLRSEFGFILEKDFSSAITRGAAEWSRRVWRLLSAANKLPIRYTFVNYKSANMAKTSYSASSSVVSIQTSTGATISSTSESPSSRPTVKPLPLSQQRVAPAIESRQTPGELGVKLEKATLSLFQLIFRILPDSDGRTLDLLRRQSSGTQYGHDVSIEFSETLQTVAGVRCHVECKNLRDSIQPGDLFGKVHAYTEEHAGIDHWILISPHSNPSNELKRILDRHQVNPKFPFSIQVWCPENGVEEFFALDQRVFKAIYGKNATNANIIGKSRAVLAVIDSYLSRLSPQPRLPKQFERYIRSAEMLCFQYENHSDLERLFTLKAPLYVKNESGIILGHRSLDGHIREWLEDRESMRLLLLGEFGDGKSTFTYTFSRQLQVDYLGSPATGWIPLRIALRDYSTAGNAKTLIARRLEDIDVTLAEFAEVRRKNRVVVFLDGFDEITRHLDSKAVGANIKILLDCCEELAGCKIVITSRLHFFEYKDERERLLSWIGRPPILIITPLLRDDVKEYLTTKSVRLNLDQNVMQSLEAMHDPIGLATKPLFLGFVSETLERLPQDLDVIKLYESYVIKSLHRKLEQLDKDGHFLSMPQDIVDGLLAVLEEVAFQIQSSGCDSVSLKQWQDQGGVDYAGLLWRVTSEAEDQDDTDSEDAMARVGTRSLLARIDVPSCQGEWHVDFCHRSVREYFAARYIIRKLKSFNESSGIAIDGMQPSPEVLEFTGMLVVREYQETISETVSSALAMCRINEGQGLTRLGGNLLSIMNHADVSLRSLDLRGLWLDFANLCGADLRGMVLAGSSLRNAVLSNANLSDADLRGCDLENAYLEDAASVNSILFCGIDKVLVSYNDGAVRMWDTSRPFTKWNTVFEFDPSEEFHLFGHSSGQICAVGDLWIYFLDWESDCHLRIAAKFIRRLDVFSVHLFQDEILWLRRTYGHAKQAELIQLASNSCASPNRALQSTLVDRAGEFGLVHYEPSSGLIFSHRKDDREWNSLCLTEDEITSLKTTRGRSSNSWFVFAGQATGHLVIWEVRLSFEIANGESTEILRSEELLRSALIDSKICAISCGEEARVAVGAADGKVVVFSIAYEPSGSAIEIKDRRTLELAIQCRGLQIDGVKTSRERRRLKMLLERQCSTAEVE
jgi:hypothetical protein